MRRRSRSSPPGATVTSTAELPCSATPTVAARCVRPLATSSSFGGTRPAADAVVHSRPDNVPVQRRRAAVCALALYPLPSAAIGLPTLRPRRIAAGSAVRATAGMGRCLGLTGTEMAGSLTSSIARIMNPIERRASLPQWEFVPVRAPRSSAIAIPSSWADTCRSIVCPTARSPCRWRPVPRRHHRRPACRCR